MESSQGIHLQPSLSNEEIGQYKTPCPIVNDYHDDQNDTQDAVALKLQELLKTLKSLNVESFEEIQGEIDYYEDLILACTSKSTAAIATKQQHEASRDKLIWILSEYKDLTNSSSFIEKLEEELREGLRKYNISVEALEDTINGKIISKEVAQKHSKHNDVQRYQQELEELYALKDTNLKITSYHQEQDLDKVSQDIKFQLEYYGLNTIEDLIEEIKQYTNLVQLAQKRGKADRSSQDKLAGLRDLQDKVSIQQKIIEHMNQKTLIPNKDDITEIKKSQNEKNFDNNQTTQSVQQIDHNHLYENSLTSTQLRDKISFQFMEKEVESLPESAEKNIKQILSFLGKILFSTNNDNKIQILDEVTAAVNLSLQMLQKNIENEDLSTHILLRKIAESQNSLRNQNWNQAKDFFQQILKQIISVDINILEEYSKNLNSAKDYIRDKKIMLFLGSTGAGKSTTIHFLAGTQLGIVKHGGFNSHIGPIKIINEELQKIISSPNAASQTIGIVPVTVEFAQVPGCKKKRESIILCDAAGFQDNRSEEQEIINGLSLIEALQECKCVIPIALHSLKDQGSRGDGLQTLANTILLLCGDNIDDLLPKFQFLFTHFDKNSQKDLIPTLNEQSNKIPQSKEAFKKFFNQMIDNAEEETLFVDPLNDSQPGILLERLSKSEAIYNTSSNFRPFISQKSRIALEDQIRKHEKSIQTALKNKNYDLIKYKLDQLQLLKELMKQEFIDYQYENIIQSLLETIKMKQNNIISNFNKCFQNGHILTESDTTNYEEWIDQVTNFEPISATYLKNEILTKENLFQNIEVQVIGLVKQVQTMNIEQNKVKIILDNLNMICHKTMFNKPEIYKDACDKFSKQINTIIEEFNQALQGYKFKLCGQHFYKVSKGIKYLNEHLNKEKLLQQYNQMKNNFIMQIKNSAKSCDYIFQSKTIDEEKSKKIQFCFELFKGLKEESSYQINNYVPELETSQVQQEFENQVLSLFHHIVAQIECAIKENDRINQLKQVEQYMQQLKYLQEMQAIQHQTQFTYFNLLSKISFQVHLIQQDIEGEIKALNKQTIKNLDSGSDIVDFEKIAKCLVGLESASWIQEYERGDFYEQTIEACKKSILNYINSIVKDIEELNFELEEPNQLKEGERLCYILNLSTVLSSQIENLQDLIQQGLNHYKLKVIQQINAINEKFIIQEQLDGRVQEINLKQLRKCYDYLLCSQQIQQFKQRSYQILENIKDILIQNLEQYCFIFNDQLRKLIQNRGKEEESQSLNFNFRKRLQEIISFEQFAQEIQQQFGVISDEDEYQKQIIHNIKQEQTEIELQLQNYYTSEIYNEFLNQLSIVKILSQLDEFLDKKKFLDIYQTNKDKLNNNKHNISNFIQLIQNHQYFDISEKLDMLKTHPDFQAQYVLVRQYLQNFIQTLIREIKSNVILYNMKINFTLENTQKLVQDINHLKDASNSIKNYIQQIDFEFIITNSLQSMNKTFTKNLQKTEQMIKIINILEAQQEIQTLSQICHELGQNLNKDLEEKLNGLEEYENEQLKLKIELYKELPLNKYSNSPPKEIIQQLEKLKENKYIDCISQINEIIKDNFTKQLEEIKEIKTKSEFNQKLIKLESIFPFLSETLQNVLKSDLVCFKSKINDTEQSIMSQLEFNIKEENIDELELCLREYQKDQFNYRTEIQKIKESIYNQVERLQKDIIKQILGQNWLEVFSQFQIITNYNTKFCNDIKLISSVYQDIQIKIQIEIQNGLHQFKQLFSLNYNNNKPQSRSRKSSQCILYDSDEEGSSNSNHSNRLNLVKNLSIDSLKSSDFNFIRIFIKLEEFQSLQIQQNELLNVIAPNYDKTIQEILASIKRGLRDMNQRLSECKERFDSQPLYNLLQKLKQWNQFYEEISYISQLKEHQLFQTIANLISQEDTYKCVMTSLLKTTQEMLEDIIQSQLINEQTKNQKSDRDKFYLSIKNRLAYLKNIKNTYEELLQQNYDKVEKVITEFNGKVTELIQQATKIVNRQVKTQDDYSNLNQHISHLYSISEVFDLSNVMKETWEIEEVILSSVRQELLTIEENQNFDEIAKMLIKIKEPMRNLPVLSKSIDEIFTQALSVIKGIYLADGIQKIGLYLNKSEIGKQILQDYEIFNGFQRLIYNQRIKSYTIDQVLEKIDGTTLDRKFLKQQYDKFKSKYEKLIEEHLVQNIDYGSFFNNMNNILQNFKKCLNKSKGIMKSVSDFIWGKGSEVQNTTFTLKWSDKSVSHVTELIAYLFAYWTLKNSGDYFEISRSDDQKMYLFQPHAAQVLSIFRILGLGTFKKEIVNHFAEIKTGEGKSITLAISASILALLDCEVYVACYSEYLSDRDYQQFVGFFTDIKVSHNIKYGTFNNLAEMIINEKGNIRDLVKNFVTTDQSNHIATNENLQKQKILLIDEVDVFFSKELFGNTYCPQSSISDPTITALLNYLWTNRDNNFTYDQHLQSQQYKDCLNNPRFSKHQYLIESALRDMLSDLKDYRSHDYEVSDNKIGYKELDNIVFNSVYGYKTLFAYYHEIDQVRIIKDANFEKFQCIGVNCGLFSYTEILLQFEIILGVTGTLKNLSNLEKEFIEKFYNITYLTYVPSVYGDSRMQKLDQREDVYIVDENDYYNFIEEEIKKRMRVSGNPEIKRPILVFFDSKKDLLKFRQNSSIGDYQEKLQLLYEGATIEEKKYKISNASCQGFVTLLTKEYGRGTDFISRDEDVNNNGGVHVLQVFLSESQSEEIQITGRTGRQGQRGSYSIILEKSTLEKFGVDFNTIESDPTHRFDYLKQMRNKFFETQYSNNIEFVFNSKKEHELASQFLKNVLDGKIDEAITYLKQQNVGKAVKVVNKVKTLCLMDATGSMSNLLQKAKNTVKEMFYRANTVLQEAQIEDGCFQLMFAVYRNYNSQDLLLQYSPWESSPDNLYAFMKTISVHGGWGNEAIEIGLSHANQEIEKDPIHQIILIGDAAANTRDQVTFRRTKSGFDQNQTKFKDPTYYQDELLKIKEHKIPIHAFYVENEAKSCFEDIAQQTGGNCQFLDINSSAGADMLTDLVTQEVLRKAGESSGKGEECVQLYIKKYGNGKSYI